MEQLYKVFSKFQMSHQFSTYVSSSSLAQKGNFFTTLITISKTNNPWIIDFGALYHIINNQQLFSSYIPCVENLKVKITYGTLSPIA